MTKICTIKEIKDYLMNQFINVTHIEEKIHQLNVEIGNHKRKLECAIKWLEEILKQQQIDWKICNFCGSSDIEKKKDQWVCNECSLQPIIFEPKE